MSGEDQGKIFRLHAGDERGGLTAKLQKVCCLCRAFDLQSSAAFGKSPNNLSVKSIKSLIDG